MADFLAKARARKSRVTARLDDEQNYVQGYTNHDADPPPTFPQLRRLRAKSRDLPHDCTCLFRLEVARSASGSFEDTRETQGQHVQVGIDRLLLS